MARTKTYTKKVSNRITSINRKLRGVEKTFGADSEQYRRYINAATAALPSDAYTLTEEGRIHIHGGKTAAGSLKLGQLEALGKLPTAKKSMDQSKKALAQNKLRAAGVSDPGDREIEQQARSISDEEALRELAAKAQIEARENSKGKLKYSEEAKADLQQKGAKTYSQLWEIIQRGEKLAAKKEYQRQYRQANKEKIAERQREYRRRNREEVNRKQREYRARRRTEQRIAQQTAERERNNPLRRR